jgi:hypothetical protein
MKRHGPPYGSGPGSERKLRVAGKPSHNRSDAGHASYPSPSSKTKPLLIHLEPRGRERFDAFFAESRIVTASAQAISDAARALHRLGYADGHVLAVRHRGANHDAIIGPLGVWRRLRVRDGRAGPRHVQWEPFPSRRVAARKSRIDRETTVGRADKTKASTAAPGTSDRRTTLPHPERRDA